MDIDGVLNSLDWYMSDDPNRGKGNIDPIAVNYLNKITDNTGAEIVVSSSWRYDFDNTKETLINCGVTGNLIGRTKDLANLYPYIQRGNEIYEWIISHKDYLDLPDGWNFDDYQSYAIIDDDNEILLNQINNFVQTNYKYGLTDNDANKAICIINNSSSLE